MIGDNIWRETAALVREIPRHGYPRELVREGPLWELLVYVDRLDEADLRHFVIALPDRSTPPLRFGYEEILRLLRQHNRPGFGAMR